MDFTCNIDCYYDDDDDGVLVDCTRNERKTNVNDDFHY